MNENSPPMPDAILSADEFDLCVTACLDVAHQRTSGDRVIAAAALSQHDAALRAEVERLTAKEAEDELRFHGALADEWIKRDRLRAEVERLIESEAVCAMQRDAFEAEVERLTAERDDARLAVQNLRARWNRAEARVAELTAAIRKVQYDFEHQHGDWRARVVNTLHAAVSGELQ